MESVSAATTRETKSQKLWGYKPGVTDFVLSIGCLMMLAAMMTAVWRGREEILSVPITYPLHFGTLAIALAITPVLLLRAKGDRLHRSLGYIWIGAMVTTAIDSFFIRDLNNGGFSLIHLLSILTIVVSWRIVSAARRGDHAAHRKHVHGIIIGALLVAGIFTFMFGRLFDVWLNLSG